jgi:hypothetical protein
MKKITIYISSLFFVLNSFSQSSKLPEFKFYSGSSKIPLVAFKEQQWCRVESFEDNVSYSVKSADIVFHLKSNKGKKEIIKNGKTLGGLIINLEKNKVESYIFPSYDSLGNLLNDSPSFISKKTNDIKNADLSAIYKDLKPGDVVEFKNIVAFNNNTNEIIELKPVVYTIE